jgi:lysophospholipase L1-like esterase
MKYQIVIGAFLASTTLLWGQEAPVPPPPATPPPSATMPAPLAPAAPDRAQSKAIASMQAKLNDWPQLDRFREENATLPPPAPGEQRVVFFGDSITDNWGRHYGDFFPGKPYINRGISGQTTPQMLVRFEQDVVHLNPAAVVILAGTNDVAGNTGPSTPQMIEDNFVSMAEIAKASNIKMIIASITPAAAYPWKPGIQPVAEIRQLNYWLRDFCARQGLVYLDYYSAMANPDGSMKDGISIGDGVHPNAQGYAIMAPLAEKAIAQALQR